MTRLIAEQVLPYRTDHDRADTPEARERRILAHMARIEALGLSGETWKEASRDNARRAARATRKQRKREYNAKRNAEIRAIKAAEKPKPPVATLTEIRADIEAVCDGLGVPIETVLNRKKWRKAVYSRRLVVKGLLDLGYSYADISRGMGRDESWAAKLTARTPSGTHEPMLKFCLCQSADSTSGVPSSLAAAS